CECVRLLGGHVQEDTGLHPLPALYNARLNLHLTVPFGCKKPPASKPSGVFSLFLRAGRFKLDNLLVFIAPSWKRKTLPLMQEQRSTVEPYTEAFELDHTSSSSSTAIDLQVYWTNVLNTGNVQNLPDYLQSPSQEDVPLRSVISHETGNLNEWNLGSSSSSEPVMNQTSHNDIEMENGWGTSANAGASTNMEERRLEAANLLSLDPVGINLNSNPVGQVQNFLQTSSSNDVSQNSDPDARLTGNHAQVSQSGLCPLYNPFGPELEQISSANGSTSACGTSTGGMSYLPEGIDGRPGSSLDGRRLSGKRKNIEGFPGQSSGSGSHSCFQQTENDLLHNVAARNISSGGLNITRSSDYLSNASPLNEHLNSRYGSGSRAAAAECLSSFSGSGSVEGSQRNFRMRINPVQQADSSAPNVWALGTSNRGPSFWSSNQPSSLLIPLNHSFESRPTIPRTSSESQSHLSSVPGAPQVVHPLPWNGTSNSRVGGFSSSPALGSERSATLRDEGSSRGTQRNSTSENPNFFPADELRNAAQGSINWGLANDNVGFPGSMASTSRVGSSSSVHSSIPPTWISHQNPPSQYPQTLSEFVRRAFPISVSDTADQLNNFLPQRPIHSSSSQEIAPQPSSVVRTHQQPLLRSAFLMDRRSDVTGASLRLRSLAAAREGRSRMISEHIRNALDLMLRGENIRFEDVLILDQSVFYGVADMHDRHRDMRLDVDNMSYEELLALEEQIGNVSTGLSEETIIKHLKQRRHLSITLTPSNEAEPCCICREEYIHGEDLGTLDCGHDFHAACIKQWLMHKNLCPICKTTAFVT
ncbi:hypothetical protein Taro_051599, partial [Colocasia esculenta]|nr:hypothetical protein [Colocasia esculenta]